MLTASQDDFHKAIRYSRSGKRSMKGLSKRGLVLSDDGKRLKFLSHSKMSDRFIHSDDYDNQRKHSNRIRWNQTDHSLSGATKRATKQADLVVAVGLKSLQTSYESLDVTEEQIGKA